MTISQIQYFLETAECKNISKAAKRLYITQPNLGRQLTAMEKELNMQLLIRSNKGIRLTPAGEMIRKYFAQIMSLYKEGTEKAMYASRGFSGTLTLGILDGLNVQEILPKTIQYFEETYPQIELQILRLSFLPLIEGLYNRSLDGAISLDVTFWRQKDLELYNWKPYHPAFAVPVPHPLASKESLDFRDFKNISLVIVDRDECAAGVQNLIKLCQDQGGFYPKLHFTTTMQDALFWVESGSKCALLNMEMQIVASPAVKMYPFVPPNETNIQLAVYRENSNITRKLLVDFLADELLGPVQPLH